MAIKHTVRAKNGKIITINTHPTRAIKLHCLECVGWKMADVRDCGGLNCNLYFYNKYNKSGNKPLLPKLTPLKTIRRECLTCCGGSYENVKDCQSHLCNLYPFRLGKNPGLAGKGNILNLKKHPSAWDKKAQETIYGT